MWALLRQLPANSLMLIQLAVCFEGEIDVSTFRDAVSMLILRHDSLRVRIVESAGIASWHYVDEASALDVYKMSPEGPLDILAGKIRTFMNRPTDLRIDAPLRCLLVSGTPSRTYLAISLHHMAGDGWSLGVIMRELAELYMSLREQRPSSLALAPSFRAFALAESQCRATESLNDALDFWIHKVRSSNAKPVIFNREVSRVRFLMQDARYVVKDMMARLTTLSRQLGATPFAIVMSAVAIVFRARTGNRFPRIAVHTANRRNLYTHGIVGPLSNCLFTDVDVSDDTAFSAVARRQMTSLVQALANDNVPLAWIVDACVSQDLPAEAFATEVECGWVDAPINGLWATLPASLAADVTSQGDSRPFFRLTGFHLSLWFTRCGADLILETTYKIDVFDRAYVDALVCAVELVIELVALDESIPCDEIVKRLLCLQRSTV